MAQRYQSVSCQQVHASWLANSLPKAGGIVLDVGAGSGRDAAYFAEQGLQVIAVEPADRMRAIGQQYTQGLTVTWLDDCLPNLSAVMALEMKYDLIVLSAVWMHIVPSQRARALRKLAKLLKPNGRLVISLRYGPVSDSRNIYAVSLEEVKHLCQTVGLAIDQVSDDSDAIQRADVTWQTVVMYLPDDGSGAFPLLRNIVINDAKSSTYKLALIRTLLRIADGLPGAVIDRSQGQIALPLGLVALYWLKQYKPLLDANIAQHPNTKQKMGFMKAAGWEQLSDHVAEDYAIGHVFHGPQATALHETLKDIISHIQRMPAKYITFPGTDDHVFTVDKPRRIAPLKKAELCLDMTTLSGYGQLIIPAHLWDLMTSYACWIEPVVLNEWVAVMRSYPANDWISVQTMYQSLEWLDAKRSTRLVRQTIEQQLQQGQFVYCIWSQQSLHEQAFAVDHCLPFARWPNNDLWNLLPTKPQVNHSKRDQLPAHEQWRASKELILHWWDQAWCQSDSRKYQFMTEASLALPRLSITDNLESVYEALYLQSMRLGQIQQLHHWRCPKSLRSK